MVDDESAMLNVCERILKQGGYDVLRARDGREALRLVENSTIIHLALVDVVMPEMNGVELANQLHTMTPTTEVVLMSGYGPEEIAKLAGKNPYRIIWKPFGAESLLHMIKNVLDPSGIGNDFEQQFRNIPSGRKP